MDVVIKVCISLGIYLALLHDAADGYTLTALQSVLPAYGTAYALGMGIMFKVAGPRLLAKKEYKRFAAFARIVIGCVYLLIPLIMGSVLPFRDGMARSYGANACVYAKDEQCVPFFTHVFGQNGSGGDFTLFFTFGVFVIGASVEAVFCVLRAVLLSMVDLDFMVRGTVLAIVFYIPAIVVAATVFPFAGHASAFFVAMYLPQVVLCVLFTYRIHTLLQKLLKGGE
jgi:hypothetical protein